jgi:RNA polymerase sigma factor (sigma-70 family)
MPMNSQAAPIERPDPQEAVERYGLWIKRTALYFVNRMPWADVDELIQWGVVGLLEARERFDPSRGAQFGAYAERRIRGAMLDSLRRDGNQARRVNKEPDAILENTIGRSADEEDPVEHLLRHANDGLIAQAVKTLSERQQLILQLFFVEELNNREIAQALDVSEAYVSKTRSRTLAKLADYLVAEGTVTGARQ